MRLIIVRLYLGNAISGVSWGTSSAIGSESFPLLTTPGYSPLNYSGL
jgi:hypothetical protein